MGRNSITKVDNRPGDARLRKTTKAAKLLPWERDICELYAAGGKSWRMAVKECLPGADKLAQAKLTAETRRLQNKLAPYVKDMVEAGKEAAILSRVELIEAARENLARAVEQNDTAGVNQTLKVLAQLGGFQSAAENKGNPNPSTAYDPVSLLEAVERLADKRAGALAIDITPKEKDAV